MLQTNSDIDDKVLALLGLSRLLWDPQTPLASVYIFVGLVNYLAYILYIISVVFETDTK